MRATTTVIDQAIAKTVEEFRKKGQLNEEPLKLVLERAKVGALPLAFPGKIVADANRDRLFIADSNHNRIVVTKLDGTLVETIGTGNIGAADGPFDKATFYRPQGMALAGDNLYIADTENHLLRRVDLKARTVETIAGTGQQSREYFKSGPARTIALNSPWDLELAVVCSTSQWQVHTRSGRWISRRTRFQLLLAQDVKHVWMVHCSSQASHNLRESPATGKTLYIADSESNIIRAIDVAGGTVKTIVGGDLFEFGDVDGSGDDVRLQHPLGVISFGDKLLIADTYNHKIKQLDPKKETVTTLFGTGKPGQQDGTSASFYEPGGLALANDKLYVADTNNHAIRVVDLKTKRVSTLRINGLTPPAQNMQALETAVGPNAEEVKAASQKLRAGADAALQIDVELPAGYHLNPLAPQRYKISVDGKSVSIDESQASRTAKDLKLPIRIPVKAATAGPATVRAQVTLFYCREDNTGTCRIKTLVWQVPVEVTADSECAQRSKATRQTVLPQIERAWKSVALSCTIDCSPKFIIKE